MYCMQKIAAIKERQADVRDSVSIFLVVSVLLFASGKNELAAVELGTEKTGDRAAIVA